MPRHWSPSSTNALSQLDQAKAVRALDLTKEEWLSIKPLCLITAKPVLYVANVAEDGFENNPLLDSRTRPRRR
jgi:ribosome-binding ATPase YchF (GTP1/OBG family)